MTSSTMVVIPAYGQPKLVSALLRDLRSQCGKGVEVVVVDNMGDFETRDHRIRVVRPVTNLRWIGTANWSINQAMETDTDVVIVLNSDIRLSPDVIPCLLDTLLTEDDDVAIAAPCYDDYWEQQRATTVPTSASAFQASETTRDVLFCDGTAMALRLSAAKRIGLFDQWSFPWHGYGADIDYCIRARRRGYRVVVTESAYVSHLRRASLGAPRQQDPRTRIEIESGMTFKYGASWRVLAGLGPDELRVTD